MVHERKEPTLSSTAVDTSDRRTRAARAAVSPRQVMVQKKEASGLLWFTLLLLLLTIATVGYTFWLQYNAQLTIAEQQTRINDLESKLALSDDESTQSVTALTANVKELDKNVKLALSEVDKLWGTRNVNKTAIEETTKKLEDSQKKVTDTLAQMKTAQTALEQNLEKKLAQPVARLEQRASEQELLVQSLRERQSEQGRSIQKLNDSSQQAATAAKEVASLKKDLNAVSQKVNSYDEAIDSIDQFRLTTNRDLLLLKQRAGVTQ